MLTPVSTRPRLSVAVLVYPFVLGLVFFATSALAHHAGTAWSPKPAWDVPAPRPARVIVRDVPTMGCDFDLKSGVRYSWLGRGNRGGGIPGPHDTVEVRTRGWDMEGNPLAGLALENVATFRVDQLIPGYAEGLQLMSLGDRARLCVPESLGYKGRPGIPRGVLVFEVELLAVSHDTDPWR